MLIPLTVGATGGLTAGRSRVAQWLTIGVTAAGVIGAVLAACALILDVPSTAASLPERVLPKVIGLLLVDTSLALMFFTPLVLGFVIGSVHSFKRDEDGWRRFGLCSIACISVIAMGVILASIIGE